MITPKVTEIQRPLEAVTPDPFAAAAAPTVHGGDSKRERR